MVSTLEKNKEKSVKFPGSCNISARNQKAKWVINDDEEFIAVLQAAQKAGEDVDDVLEKVTQFNVRKREASKLLEIWESSGKLDGFLKKAKKGSGDIVSKDPKKVTVSIKFLDDEDEVNDDSEVEVSIPAKDGGPSNIASADYDGI